MNNSPLSPFLACNKENTQKIRTWNTTNPELQKISTLTRNQINIKNTGTEISSLLENIKNSPLSKDEILLFCEENIPSNLSFEAVEFFLKDKNIHLDIRYEVIDKLKQNIPFPVVEKFLGNTDIDLDIQFQVIEKITNNIPFTIAENFLRKTSIQKIIQYEVIEKLSGDIAFETAKNFLENEEIFFPIRYHIIKKLEKNISFQSIKNFLTHESIDHTVRSQVANRVSNNIPFREIQKFTSNNHINPQIISLVLQKGIPEYKSIFEGILPSTAFQEIINSSNTNLRQCVEIASKKAWEKINLPEKTDNDTREKNAKYLNQKQGIESTTRDLSAYLRYMQTNNHGATQEVITSVLNQYIQGGYSKIWSNIRLIPRRTGTIPMYNESLSHCTIRNVQHEEFQKALYFGADAVISSYSTDTGRTKYRGNALVSSGSTGDLNTNIRDSGICQQFHFDFEQEKSQPGDIFLSKASLQEIVESYIFSLQKFEDSLLGEQQRS